VRFGGAPVYALGGLGLSQPFPDGLTINFTAPARNSRTARKMERCEGFNLLRQRLQAVVLVGGKDYLRYSSAVA
jgi:hypothetical protein